MITPLLEGLRWPEPCPSNRWGTIIDHSHLITYHLNLLYGISEIVINKKIQARNICYF